MKFYTFKQIYLTLGISDTTLRKRVKQGIYPELDLQNKHLPRSVGYFENKLNQILGIDSSSPSSSCSAS